MGFIDAAHMHCGPEPYAAAAKDKTPITEEEAKGWSAQIKRWMGCAAELGARNQKADVLTIAALLDDSDAN